MEPEVHVEDAFSNNAKSGLIPPLVFEEQYSDHLSHSF
jgi:hypothetical protein